MNPDRWERVGRIFDEAGELSGEPREAFLAEACSGDPELLSEVRSLLSEAEKGDDFLDALPPGVSLLSGRRQAKPRALPPEVAEAAADPARRLGRYVLLSELGRGGFGTVFLAWDTELSRKVAVKRLHGGADLARFRREARTVAGLAHPNIATVHDVGEDPPHIAMEFVDGLTAGEIRPPAREAARIVRDAARALDHAHGRGIVHRDVKPQNVMVDTAGRVFVMDFGMARGSDAESLTVSGALLGTPAWMAPEQALGSGELDARTDVYGLGATLSTLLTGRPPFESSEIVAVLRDVVERDPPSPRSLDPRIDRDLDTIVRKAMAKAPAKRYGTAAAMADDLDRWLAGEPISARAAGPLDHLARRVRRHPWTSALVAALVTILLGGSVAWYFRPAHLVLSGVPSGVRLSLDGREVPAEARIEVRAGPHLVEASGADWEPWRREVLLARGTHRELRVDLRRRQGRIVIAGPVPGASLALEQGGVVLARHGVPTEAQLATGRYVGHASAPGRWSRWRQLRIEAGRTVREEVLLPEAIAFRHEVGNTPLSPREFEAAGSSFVVTGVHEGKLDVLEVASGRLVATRTLDGYVGEPVTGRFFERGRVDLCIPGPGGESLHFFRLPGLEPIRRTALRAPAGDNRPVYAVAAGDVDGDGLDEVVSEMQGGAVTLLAGPEGIRWAAALGPGLREPTLADVDGDGRAELAIVVDGRLEVRDGATGELRFGAADRRTANVVVDDFDRDCLPDFAFRSETGELVILSGARGDVLLRTPGGRSGERGLLAADDGVLFSVDFAGAEVSARRIDGRVIWRRPGPSSFTQCRPFVAATGPGGRRELAVYDGATRELVGLDSGTGEPRWGVAVEPFLFRAVTGRAGALSRLVLATATAIVGLAERRGMLEDEAVQGVRASVVAGDLDGDGRPEAVVVARRGRIRGYSGDARIRFEADAPVSAVTPALVDVDGDGRLDVLGGAWDPGRSLSAWSGRDGRLLWQRGIGAGFEGEIAVGDLDGDGRPEGVVATWNGRAVVCAFSVADGRPLWESGSPAEHLRGPVLVDLDGDGRLDVVAATRTGVVRALRGRDGARLFERPSGKEIRALPLAVPGGVAVAEGGSLVVLGRDGAARWTASIAATRTDPLLADLDGDGRPEIAVVDGAGCVLRFDPETGRALSRSSPGGAAGRSVALADFDGDGIADLVVPREAGRIDVISVRRGATLLAIPGLGRLEGAPAVADFDGDGRPDLAVGSVDGRVRMLAAAVPER